MSNRNHCIFSFITIFLFSFGAVILKLPTSIGLFGLASFLLLNLIKFKNFVPNKIVIVMMNILFISLISSLISVFLNLFTWLKSNKDLKIIDISKGVEIIAGRDEPLGYKFKPGQTGTNKKVLSNNLTQAVIDTKYNIDLYGNRLLPFSDSIDYTKSILFLGGSLTFGEALNDDETLPYYVSRKLGINTINAGMNGYGAHQSLYILENYELYKARTSSKKIKFIIYRSILPHINRAAGYANWDSFGPCYEVNKRSNSLEYKGSFLECKNRLSIRKRLQNKLLNYFKNSAEPWTVKTINNLHYRKYSNENYLREDYSRYLKMIYKMKSISDKLNVGFIVIVEDLNTYPNKCLEKVKYAKNLINDLEKFSISVVKTSDYYSYKQCKDHKLQIKHDGHPSALANKTLANGLANYIKNQTNIFY